MRLPAKQFVAVARLTVLESIRQPICLLLAGSGILFTALLPVLIMYQLGDSQKLVRDSALAMHFLFGLLFAGYASGAAVQQEIKRGTVSSVLVKPIGRELFFLAKFTGVATVLVLFSIGFGTTTLLTTKMAGELYTIDWWAGGPLLGAIGLAIAVALFLNYFMRRPFVSTAFVLLIGFLLMALVINVLFTASGKRIEWGSTMTWKLVPASVLVTMALLVLAGVAVALATRLDTVPTLAICTVVFLLGLMTDYLFGRVAGQSKIAAVLYAVLPNWQHFWLTDALSGDGTIPWLYVGHAGLYAVFYLAGVLCLGILAFRRTELKA